MITTKSFQLTVERIIRKVGSIVSNINNTGEYFPHETLCVDLNLIEVAWLTSSPRVAASTKDHGDGHLHEILIHKKLDMKLI